MGATTSKTLETNPLITEETLEDQSAQASDQSKDSSNEEKLEGGEEGEEEGECGFCLFMKGGGCKDTFIAWENCIEAVEKDKGEIAEKCFDMTAALKSCMDAHADYYEPILRAEKVAKAEAVKESEQAKEWKDKSEEQYEIIEVEQGLASEKQES